jgi:DNA processing protein
MHADLESWQCLAAAPGIGPVLFRQLIKRFGSPERVLAASPEELCSLPNIDEKRARAILKSGQVRLPRGWPSLLERLGARLLTYRDPAYPQRLLTTYDFPPLLYVRGQLTEPDDLAVAVVGSRRASPYGQRVAESVSAGLVRRGITVVSGLARGIDSIAHKAALDNGGRTIAVLGSGIDIVYPGENQALAERIVEGGAIVSEFPLGTKPEPGHFPRRNRIISGLSLGVVVIEARIKSGALLTAHFALEQGREVFAVPGDINLPGTRGPHRLIQEGAKLVWRVDDILEEFPLPGKLVSREPSAEPALDVTADEGQILALLTDCPVPVDDLIDRSGLRPAEVLAALFSLEMKGIARQLSGKRFVRK